jgi:hypothetical protein
VRRRPIDVSLEPGLLSRVIPRAFIDSVVEWVSAFAALTGLPPLPHATATLDAVVGAMCWPLLGAVYDHGAAAATALPRWAAPSVAHRRARDATAALVGPHRTTRRSTAALARSLLPSDPRDPPALLPLALAAMGADVLDADRLANVLEHSNPIHAPEDWPTVDDVARFRRCTSTLGAGRVERLLRDTGATADGPRLLHETVRVLLPILRAGTPNLPSRLVELHAFCCNQLPDDPQPRPPAPRPNRDTALADAFRPPRAPARRTANGFSSPPEVAAAHRHEVQDGLRLVVPRTAAELTRWGERLHNCIATFADAVAARQSWLIGVEHDGVLRYCIEIRPDRTVRQFLGDRNAPVPEGARVAVCRALADLDILDAARSANDPWLQSPRPER